MSERLGGFSDADLKALVGVGNLIAKLASEVQGAREYNEKCRVDRLWDHGEIERLKKELRKRKGKQ